MKMERKIALVTGASRGIGQAILHELARRGAYAVGTATSESGAAAIGAALKAAGLEGEGRMLDVNDAAACEALVDDVVKAHGRLDILVNNAGITRDTLLMRMKDEDWDAVIQTNLTSVFRMSKAAIRPMMKARSGRIVSIASVVGAMGNPGQTNYAAAKAGMMGF
ncbi:MAG: SDR family NAD(P)-dependent oxidoreductase, partial [Gallionellaceae bacterium]|nr:SDR family NAD(P)-dependent oxidoreductase [Gallionellaceae bacterium]